MRRAVATVGIITLLFSGQDTRCAGVPSSEMQRQKAALLQRLLSDSPLSRRIAASGSPDARRLLAQAAELSAHADKLMSAGDASQADSALNQAMNMLNRAGQMSPDLSHLNHEQWVRHGKLIASVESLQASINRHVEGEQAGSMHAWRRELESLMQRARALASTDQVLEANLVLVQAEAVLLGAFKRSYHSNTVNYSPRFRDVQEEFQFELARHASYLQLVPLAITELNPPLPAVQAIDRHMSRSRSGRERAERLASERSFDAALKLLLDATSELQLALAAAGLNVPKETKP